MYEVIQISSGIESVLYATENKVKCVEYYVTAPYSRIRVDGRTLSIIEADKMVGKARMYAKRKAAQRKGYVLYTIVDNKTGKVICEDVTSDKAAREMGISLKTFYCLQDAIRRGRNKKYTITKRKRGKNE